MSRRASRFTRGDGQTVELAPSEVICPDQPGRRPGGGDGQRHHGGGGFGPDPGALKAEGLAREIVRRVQEMRKKAGFNIDDRIRTYYQLQNPSQLVLDVMADWAEYICSETLTLALVEGAAPPDAYQETQQVEGETVILAVKKS